MSETGNLIDEGKRMLQKVALRYAGQHGLRPDKVEWVDQGGAVI